MSYRYTSLADKMPRNLRLHSLNSKIAHTSSTFLNSWYHLQDFNMLKWKRHLTIFNHQRNPMKQEINKYMEIMGNRANLYLITKIEVNTRGWGISFHNKALGKGHKRPPPFHTNTIHLVIVWTLFTIWQCKKATTLLILEENVKIQNNKTIGLS